MLQKNVPIVLLARSLSGTTTVYNVALTTVEGYVVRVWTPESHFFLRGPKEAGNLPRWEAHRLDVPGRHTADVIEGRVDKGKKSDRSRLLRGCGDCLRWIESSSDLPVAVTVPFESVPEQLQLIMQAFVVINRARALCSNIENTACLLEGCGGS
jgi:hypothetical protein